MGKVVYTKEQQRVIDERGANLLVSAAAGSGKTAVLTQRIVSLLSDKENPVDIDRFLIVTFTNAAASEMRERIGQAIEKCLEKEPGNEWMQRQMTLLPNAQITTIDSFCLFVIRNNFGDIGLDPGFRIMDEGERKLLMKDVLEELLEAHYGEENDTDFRHLVECYCGNGKETELEKQIITMYEFSMSMPYPEKWLADAAGDYEIETFEEIEKTGWWKALEETREALIIEAKRISQEGLELCQGDDGPKAYLPSMEALVNLCKSLKENGEYQKRFELLRDSVIPPLSRTKGKDEDPDVREKVKAQRDGVKKLLDSLKGVYYSLDASEILEDMIYAGRAARKLLELVQEYKDKFFVAKREKNVIDFSDMEHFALEILLRKEGEEVVPTKAALEYRDYFSHVMVDEYQDSNYVQEYILKSVAREDNYFMVGDIKQSIYRFRLAKPEIFLEKYKAFQDSGKDIRIDLNKNFRSREEVLLSVNDVFEEIMNPLTAGMDYDATARLYAGASYPKPEADKNRTELVLIEKPEEEIRQELQAAEGSHEVEAFWVAERIKEMLAMPFMVTDKESGLLRPVSYKDIVILLRSMDGWEGDFRRILEAKGIPAYSSVKNGYFAAMEVRTILNFLHVLNNPRQDIPFYGVLTSYFGGFSEEEAALVRGVEKDKRRREENQKTLCLYDALQSCQEESITIKKEQLLLRIQKYRKLVSYVKIRDLLELIYRETGYLDYVTALPGGKKRRANLLLLLEKAKAFESTSYHGLFHFVRYIGQLKEQEVDYGEAGILDENADVVRIMTIHKSKGLEFPVCFLCGMGKRINKKDASKAILLDTDSGIGVDYINPVERVKRSGLKKRVMAEKIVSDCIAEEMRVLYVAMTRAKEKLIMTAVVDHMTAVLDKLPEAGELSNYKISMANTYLDFVLNAYANRGILKDYLRCVFPEDLLAMDFREEMQDCANLEALEKDVKPENGLQEILRKKFTFVYPYPELKGLYTKTTVSELKKAAYEEADGTPMFEPEEEAAYVPTFVREQEEKSFGTLRGSAYHRVLELIPYHKLYKRKLSDKEMTFYVERVLEENLESGRLSKEYAQLIFTSKCVAFLKSNLAGRMMAADARGQLYKEKPFFLGVPARELKDSFPEEESILVQGVIDVYLEEEGELVLADYKTDRVKTEAELILRYQTQLDIYARALEQITGKKVKEKIIYSLALNKEISI